jgi:hypothetical protein
MNRQPLNLFKSLLSKDMATQARQVEGLAIILFLALLLCAWLLWNYKIEVSPGINLNIFELLLSKK